MSSRFMLGSWMVDPTSNEVSRGSDVRRLEGKVMQVLVVLAARAGEAVSRDQLIEAVWPHVVVTDSTLTRCISQLRRALDDDARGPALIETIPKVGYRLASDVLEVASPLERPASEREKNIQGISTRSLQTRRTGLVALVVAVALGMASLLMGKSPPTPPRPITSTPGAERGVSFSPDARSIIYAGRASGSSNTDLFLLDIEADSPLQLTHTDEDELYPVWSPDGHRLAFFRCAGWRRCDLYLGSSVGLDAAPILHGLDSPWGMTWIAGSDGPIYSARDSVDGLWKLYEVRGSASVRISSPPPTIRGDLDPVAAPGGRTLAFKRSVGESVGDLFLMDLDDGNIRRLTSDAAGIAGHTWEKHGRALLISSDRSGTNALWRVSLSGHAERVLDVPTVTPAFPVISPDGRRLVYQEVDLKHDLAEISFADSDEPQVRTTLLSGAREGAGSGTGASMRVGSGTGASMRVGENTGAGVTTRNGASVPNGAGVLAGVSDVPYNSSFLDDRPALAPDRSAVAFISWRSGAPELWKASADGSVLRLTSFEGSALGAPSWSPDGTSIALSAVVDNHSRLFVVDAKGGSLRSIGRGDYNDRTPSWSPDAAWIYFASDRKGTWGIWRVPSDGGAAEHVTGDGGFRPRFSPQGDRLYFVRHGQAGLWSMPAAGGDPRRIHALPAIHDWGTWDVTEEGVVVVDRRTPKDRLIRIDPISGNGTFLIDLPVNVVSGKEALTIDSDSRRAVVAFSRGFESDLFIVDEYR